jgi:hypothetical protein
VKAGRHVIYKHSCLLLLLLLLLLLQPQPAAVAGTTAVPWYATAGTAAFLPAAAAGGTVSSKQSAAVTYLYGEASCGCCCVVNAQHTYNLAAKDHTSTAASKATGMFLTCTVRHHAVAAVGVVKAAR